MIHSKNRATRISQLLRPALQRTRTVGHGIKETMQPLPGLPTSHLFGWARDRPDRVLADPTDVLPARLPPHFCIVTGSHANGRHYSTRVLLACQGGAGELIKATAPASLVIRQVRRVT